MWRGIMCGEESFSARGIEATPVMSFRIFFAGRLARGKETSMPSPTGAREERLGPKKIIPCFRFPLNPTKVYRWGVPRFSGRATTSCQEHPHPFLFPFVNRLSRTPWMGKHTDDQKPRVDAYFVSHVYTTSRATKNLSFTFRLGIR